MAGEIRSLLAKIWSMLGQAGLSNTREYVEYIAAVLTESSFPFSPELKPKKPTITKAVDEAEIRGYLAQINEIAVRTGARDEARTLDRYVLFYASILAQKDTYPIPRHIVDFMLNILDVRPEHNFADFTCGPGGFLVNSDRGTGKWPKRIVGIEISPDMARIAAANATLHNLDPSQMEIIADDAFHACGPEGKLRHEPFNRIAMAPPFGRNIAKSLAQETLGFSNTSASEVLFTYLAQAKLKPGGRAVVMVPAVLLANRTGTALRQKLVEERLLEGVITLKPGMLQPFNNLRVALLLIYQPEVGQTPLEQCWFLSLENDGYPLNPSRDLLAPPPLIENDLPLAEKVLLPEHDFQPIMIGYEGHDGALVQTILEKWGSANFPIVNIRVPIDTTLAELRHFVVQKDSQQEHYLVAQMVQDNQTYPIEIPLQTRRGKAEPADPITDLTEWRRNLYGLSEDDDLPPGNFIFGQATTGQMLAVTREGRLLGFSMPLTNLSGGVYSLVAEEYLTKVKEPVGVTPTEYFEKPTTLAEAVDEISQLLNALRQDLLKAKQQINNLGERLEFRGAIDKPLPPLIHAPEQAAIINFIGTEQQIHWYEIQQHVEVELPGKGTYARPFTSEELEIPSLSKTGVHQILRLLESLGLLIQVSGLPEQTGRNEQDQRGERPRVAYRRITSRDICSPKENPWK